MVSVFDFRRNLNHHLFRVQTLASIFAFAFVFVFVSMSHSETSESRTCRTLFSNSQAYTVFVNMRIAIDDQQTAEIVADAERAVAFAEKHFRLPPYIRLNLASENGFDFQPSFNPSSDTINASYRYGMIREGRFVSKSRRHARDIFYHEFGHLVFETNIGSKSDWVRRYQQSVARLSRTGGTYVRSIDRNFLEAHLSSYNELFADIFAVAISGNPRAMSTADFFVLMSRRLHGFQAPQYEVVRSRDFLHRTEVETWNESQVHVRFSPARSAFSEDPYVRHLLQTDPQRLVRLAADAIRIELGRLFGDEAAVLSSTSVPELNRRLIAVMNEVLRADQERAE